MVSIKFSHIFEIGVLRDVFSCFRYIILRAIREKIRNFSSPKSNMTIENLEDKVEY
jgi:hypothetical protein